MSTQPQSDFAGRHELARRLGFSVKSVDRMRKDGRLPPPAGTGTRYPRWYWPAVVAHLTKPN